MAIKVRHRDSYIAELDDGKFELTFEPIEDSIKVTKTEDGYELRYLTPDPEPFSPREDDNLTKMVCFHKRYALGDKHSYNHEDYSSWSELAQAIIEAEEPLIIKPLYLYDHSGITIKTSPFSCPWDSGQVGFVFITEEQRELLGAPKDNIEKSLEGEVEAYDQYLRGDVYGIVCEKYGKDRKQIDQDSVWGYYGYEDALEALKTEI